MSHFNNPYAPPKVGDVDPLVNFGDVAAGAGQGKLRGFDQERRVEAPAL